MSKYNVRPIELTGLKTIPIERRGGKVTVHDFARPHIKGEPFLDYLDSLPRLLAADSFRSVAEAILQARAAGKPIIWGFGGHVIKCGLAPILIDLMKRGFATAFTTNGSGAIHDFEIAIAGQTSEDVEAVLPDGSFGCAEETGNEMNTAISEGNRYLLGMGESLGRRLDLIAKLEFAPKSLLTEAYRAGVPVTVHVAIGTDTPHTHPKAEPAAIGGTTHRDFRLFCSLVKEMDQGGVYLNVGSAVILPEVFLKAVSLVRNLGNSLAQFTTVNCDFLQHYRPKMNVVDRPHADAGGKGYSLTGHHEIMIPLLAATLIECES